MLEYVSSKERDEVFAASLLRMAASSGDERTIPVLLGAVKDQSPLVRSSAADALQHVPTREAVRALVVATGDEYRLVRVRAASSLAGYPNLQLNDAEKKSINAANAEYLASLTSRSDQWSSYFNLGNYYTKCGDPRTAISFYDTSLKLEPRAVPVMVNKSMAYARLGETKKSEAALQKALKSAPDSPAANFNMGLLKAEQNDLKEAENYLKAALKYDPQMAQAAYNLCAILAKDRINEAVAYCRKAADLSPQDPRYAYTLGFFQQQKGETGAAVSTLNALIIKQPGYFDAYLLLGEIYEKEGKKGDAGKIYNSALALERAPESFRNHIRGKLESLRNP
jgi:tetratricopeptide (TPR) repeat protein